MTPRTPEPRPFLSPKDLVTLEASVPSLSLHDAVQAFRVGCDARLIPKDLQPRVLALATTIIERARRERSVELTGLVMNLRLDYPEQFHLACHAYTLVAEGSRYIPNIPGVDDHRSTQLSLLAGAYIIMRDAGELPNPRFIGWINHRRFGSEDLEQVPDVMRDAVRLVFAEMFNDLACTNPLTRRYPGRRLPELTYSDLMSSMSETLARITNRPFDG